MTTTPSEQTPPGPGRAGPSSLLTAIGPRGAIAGGLVLALAIALATLRPEVNPPPDTVGVVPEQTTTTLLEFLPDTDPPDPTAEPTVPPRSLFGGDPCTALVAVDFTLVIGGIARGELVDVAPLSDDTCGFLIIVADQEFNISVQAVDVSTFGKPPGDEERTALVDIGESAYGVASEAGYAVWVKVDNGYFVVIAPDQPTAIHLAKAAVGRADPTVTE